MRAALQLCRSKERFAREKTWGEENGRPSGIVFRSIHVSKQGARKRMKVSLGSTRTTASSSGACRLCLCAEANEEQHSTKIFATGEASEILRRRILDCCPVELVEHVALPNAICDDCQRKLAATYEFRERCRQSERTLRLLYRSCYANPNQRYGGDAADGPRERDRSVETAQDSDPCTDSKVDESDQVRDEEKELSKREGAENREWRERRGSPGSSKDGVGAVKKYLCDMCSKTFASKSGLRFHLRSHTGAKPHLCRHCGKGFAIPSYAKRHETIHSGDKHLVCRFCSATFASPNGLRYHSRSHTGEANYRCDVCAKSFRRRKYLTEHAHTHTGEKPYVCKMCDSSYGSSGSLFAHEKRCRNKQSIRESNERDPDGAPVSKIRSIFSVGEKRERERGGHGGDETSNDFVGFLYL